MQRRVPASSSVLLSLSNKINAKILQERNYGDPIALSVDSFCFPKKKTEGRIDRTRPCVSRCLET
jgi:hypothetical protein